MSHHNNYNMSGSTSIACQLQSKKGGCHSMLERNIPRPCSSNCLAWEQCYWLTSFLVAAYLSNQMHEEKKKSWWLYNHKHTGSKCQSTNQSTLFIVSTPWIVSISHTPLTTHEMLIKKRTPAPSHAGIVWSWLVRTRDLFIHTAL